MAEGNSEERIAAWQRARGGVVVADEDVRALIGLLAVLEARAMTEELDPDSVDRIATRLARDGVSTDAGLPAALNVLNQRLRTARGEYAV